MDLVDEQDFSCQGATPNSYLVSTRISPRSLASELLAEGEEGQGPLAEAEVPLFGGEPAFSDNFFRR